MSCVNVMSVCVGGAMSPVCLRLCVCTWLLGRLGRVARVAGRSLPITPCVLMSPAAVLGWLAMTNAATLGALPIDTVGAAGEGDAQAVAAWLDEGGGVEARCTEFDGTTRC